MRLRNIIFITASLCLAVFSYAQNQDLKLIDSLVDKKEVQASFTLLKKIDSTGLDLKEKAKYYNLYARSYFLDNQSDQSYQYYLHAKRFFSKLNDQESVASINLALVVLLNTFNSEELDYQPFLDEYIEYAKSQDDAVLLAKAYMQVGKSFINSEPTKTIHYFKKSLDYGNQTSDTLMLAKIHHNMGVLYSEHTPHIDSAFYHYDIALKEYKRQNMVDFMSYIFINQASIYKRLGQYNKAIENYLKADSLPIKEFRRKNKQLLYGWTSDAYEQNRQYEEALEYLKRHLVFKDSVAEDEKSTKILDIQTKYETEKKEKKNLQLKQNRTWLIAILVVVSLLLLLSYLAFKNQKNKREIESQKLEKILKQQELSSIDAMVAGQEKERQRIADDLHDNLGSLLATLKLHFNNLKIKRDRLKEEEDALFAKTDNLIDETYQKVRSMAHVKHAGIRADESLLPSVKNFAAKVSIANKLVIEVIDDGMERRLENTLELTIFRIIQELVTNVIKHANASEATIHLTNRGDTFNILVEDNGVGFNTGTIKPREGMGLYSIQKRVEFLGGEVTIESVKHNGTSIIIDIPLA